MTVLANAQQFLNLGIAVIPIQFREKTPDARKLPGGKWEWYKKILPSTEQLGYWFNGEEANYGVVAGWQNLALIDFDDVQEYARWVMWANRRGGLPKMLAEGAYRVQTARGVHVYVRMAQRGANRKLGKIDIKFRGYVLGPGSIHPSGAEYRALSSTLLFPVVQALSDIFPVELLQTAVIPERVRIPVRVVERADPWQSAMQQVKRPGHNSGSIDEIKRVYTVEQFFTQLQPTGEGWLLTCCPFHDDHNPSFWVNTDKQICNCFSCQFPKPLDVIDLYAKLYGMTNAQAIRALGDGLN